MAVTVEVFLDWLDTQEGKFEYDRGTIGMMVKVTRNHALIGSRFVYLLMQRLDGQPYDVLSEAFAVHVGRSVRFPDVLVQRTEHDGKALQSEAPLLIVEVLSPSSFHLDMVVKREEYLALPTLQAYVVASQDEPDLAVWRRGAAGGFPTEPEEVTGLDAELTLDGLGVTLPLRELYSGVK